MSLNENSKPITKGDDAAKDFIQASLGGNYTRGFDIDSIYCEIKDGKILWTIFEFLKCDTVTPVNSHPNRYWSKNKRKFLSLWALRMSLISEIADAKLILVNYRDKDTIMKVMNVERMEENAIFTKDAVMTYEEWCAKIRAFNTNKEGSTWDVLKLLA